MYKKNLLFVVTLLLLSLSALPAWANTGDCLQIPITGEASSYLLGFELCNTDDFPAADDTQIVSANNDKVIINLGLGETLNKTIILKPYDETAEFNVEQSFETSLTIMNEGPHMDLLDWRHHIADWSELPRKNTTSFISQEVNSSSFPAVTNDEIVSAVAEESAKWARDGYDPGERWTTVAKDCKRPETYPCGISVSKVFLRVMVKNAGQWQQIQLIEFKIPMGC